MFKDAEFFIANPDEFDKLSEEQQNRVYETGGVELSEADAETDEDTDGSSTEATDDETETDDDIDEQSVIKSKNGKHEIPYSELEDARSEAQNWRATAEQQAELIKQLENAKIADQGTGKTTAEDAAIEDYKSNFPEVAEDLKPFIKKMIDDGVKAALVQVEQRVAPVEQTLAGQIQNEEDARVLSVHPDAPDIFSEANKDFYDWMKTTVNIIEPNTRTGLNLQSVFDTGNSWAINEMLRQYKEDRGLLPIEKSTVIDKDVLKSQVKEKISGIKPKTPGTFSDIPGAGTNAKVSRAEEVSSWSSSELEKNMLTMTEAQRQKFFEELV